MRFRSFILVCCMVVVPALAMFLHHMPTLPRPQNAWGRTVGWANDSPNAAGHEATTAAVPEVGGGSGRTSAIPAGAADVGPASIGTTRQAPSRVPGPESDDAFRAAHGRLVALGMTEIECRPTPAAGGMVLCSGRVAVDATGQLQRLFQAAAADAATALDALAEDVTAWRQRTGMP